MRRLSLLSIAALISVLAVAAHSEKSTVPSGFSDREIFEGVVFGVGPVAQVVPEARDQLRPEIYAQNADELASMAQVRAALLASVERAEPGLVGEFARVARSGDPAAIRAMLERATEAVNAAADERPGSLDGTLFANTPNPNPRSKPGAPRPTPQLQQDTPLFANTPNPNPRSKPGAPRPTPQLQQDTPLFANTPNPNPRSKPGAPRPTPQLQQDAPLFANTPNPNPRSKPGAPRPTPQLTAPQLAAQPAWALFSSALFTEQLAGSMALKLERIEG